jgi:hypothetical protein
MTDLQVLALACPIVMVALVVVTVTIEEWFNQAEMKREGASRQSVPAGYSGSMTIEVGPAELKKLLNEIEDSAKRRAG